MGFVDDDDAMKVEATSTFVVFKLHELALVKSLLQIAQRHNGFVDDDDAMKVEAMSTFVVFKLQELALVKSSLQIAQDIMDLYTPPIHDAFLYNPMPPISPTHEKLGLPCTSLDLAQNLSSDQLYDASPIVHIE